jgi:hypothetical protein
VAVVVVTDNLLPFRDPTNLHMSTRVFDRETLLDLLVNVVPLVILLFFIGLFLVYDPFGYETSIYTYLQIGIVGVTFLALAYLTYASGKAIATDEKRLEDGE